jgi:prepilin-type N-terminal cleavage/methylation domain-containing protein
MIKHTQRGVSLLELIIVIIILGIIVVAASPLIIPAMQAPGVMYVRTQLAAQGEYTLTKMVSDISDISGSNVSALCSSTSGNSFSFITKNNQRIIYSFSNGNIQQEIDDNVTTCNDPTSNTPAVLSNGISGLSFTYLDETLSSTNVTSTNAKYVQVQFTYTFDSRSHTFTQIVFLRGSAL